MNMVPFSVVSNLQLRLSLLGGMFGTVLQHGTLTTATLLMHIIITGIADQDRFSDLYFTCIDMLGVILHSLSGGDIGILLATGSSSESVSKRDKQQLERKIRKEIGESDLPQLSGLRQLIPVPKEGFEIIKFKKISHGDSKEKKKWRNVGLEVAGKERINPWDLIEGAIQFDNGKNKRAIDLGTKCPAPLCMSWFGASREDRFPDDWQYREKMGRFPEKRPLEKWLELPELPSEGKHIDSYRVQHL